MAQQICVKKVYLILVCALLAGASLVAQSPSDTAPLVLPPIPSARLTVRPHAMTIGTRNPAAGEYLLDSLNQGYDSNETNGYHPVSFPNSVYVPPRCAGAVRCPLVVYLDADHRYESENEWERELADKYGMLLLTLNVLKPFAQRAPMSAMTEKYGENYLRYLDVMTYFDITRVDAGLAYVLGHYAVDPDKIAAFGKNFSLAVFVGRNNTDVFSRIAEIDVFEDWPTTLVPPKERNPKSLFYLVGQPDDFHASFPTVHSLRQDGYTVTFGLTLRGHMYRWDDRDRLYRWLRDSWAAPAAAAAPAVADSAPVLTAEALSAMNTFWTQLATEQFDSIRNSHPKEVTVLVGTESMPVVIVDLPALAAEFPSVAEELKAAGLTAQQAEIYWRALIGAGAVIWSSERNASIGKPDIPVEPGSVLAQNVAMAKAHEQEFNPRGPMLIFPCDLCRGLAR